MTTGSRSAGRQISVKIPACLLSGGALLCSVLIAGLTLMMTGNFNFSGGPHILIYLASLSAPVILWLGLRSIFRPINGTQLARWVFSLMYFAGSLLLWHLPAAKDLIH